MTEENKKKKIYIGTWIPQSLHHLYKTALHHEDISSSRFIKKCVEEFVTADLDKTKYDPDSIPVWRAS